VKLHDSTVRVYFTLSTGSGVAYTTSCLRPDPSGRMTQIVAFPARTEPKAIFFRRATRPASSPSPAAASDSVAPTRRRSSRGGSTQAVAPAATTLLAYSLGLALPFLAAAVAFAHVLGPLRSLRNWFAAGRAVGAAILVGTGALLFFDRIWWLNVAARHLQDAIGFPSLR
jgi:hypothetical protein